jgi:hypothetical protein
MTSQCDQVEDQIEFHKLVNGRRVARFTVSEKISPDVEQLLRDKGFEHQHHANCRPVMIWGEINHELYNQRMANHGAKPIHEKWFPSARAASLHFGLNPTAVSIALSQAKERGEDVAVVAGVPVRWADEVTGD